MYNGCKLKIMCRIALFMILQLSRGIGNNSSIVHQNTTESLAGCITIDYEIFADVRQG
jgi:hypothetical protein